MRRAWGAVKSVLSAASAVARGGEAAALNRCDKQRLAFIWGPADAVFPCQSMTRREAQEDLLSRCRQPCELGQLPSPWARRPSPASHAFSGLAFQVGQRGSGGCAWASSSAAQMGRDRLRALACPSRACTEITGPPFASRGLKTRGWMRRQHVERPKPPKVCSRWERPCCLSTQAGSDGFSPNSEATRSHPPFSTVADKAAGAELSEEALHPGARLGSRPPTQEAGVAALGGEPQVGVLARRAHGTDWA